MNSTRRSSIAFGVCVTMSACATHLPADRPADWPPPRGIASCEELSGHYFNHAIAATSWLTHTYEEPPPLLSEVFYDGPPPSLDDSATIQLKIRPDLSVWLTGAAGEPRPADIEGKSTGRCLPAAFIWERESDAYSEHSRERQHLTLEFTIARDGSLFVHLTFASKGTGFLMVPFSQSTERWLRFARAP